MLPLPPHRRQPDPAPGQLRFALDLPPDLLAFQGHFPGNPLLPGVVQVDWAIQLGVAAFGSLGHFRGLDQVKFLKPVLPGSTLELLLTLERNPGSLRFEYLNETGRVSSGTIRFQPPSTAPGDGPP